VTEQSVDAAGYLPEAKWSIPDAIGVFVAGLIAAVIALVVLVALNGGEEPSGITQLVVSSIVQGGVQIGLMAYLSRSRGIGRFHADFGVAMHLRDSWGLLAGVGLQFAVVYLVLVPLQLLLGLEEVPEQQVAEIAEDVTGTVNALLVLVVVVVVAPLVEEMVFRGMLLSRLRRSFAPTPAVLISAVAFAAVHLADPNAIFVIPGLIVIGMVLGYQALRTGDLSLPFFTHAGVNLIAAIGLLYGEELIERLEELEAFIGG